MPWFTPDLQQARSKLGRPYALWFTSAWWEAVTLTLKGQQWVAYQAPDDVDLGDADRVYQQRLNHVTYDDVRDYNLTDLGAVRYIDEYDDRFTDEFISLDNTPYDRATSPEPIHYPGSS